MSGGGFGNGSGGGIVIFSGTRMVVDGFFKLLEEVVMRVSGWKWWLGQLQTVPCKGDLKILGNVSI